MKSSPRPPRRFSRWQTTKRTFVLGGAVSKSSPNDIDQGTKTSSQASEKGKNELQSLPPLTQVGDARDDIGYDQTHQSPQASVKPKRKLRLVSSSSTNDDDLANHGKTTREKNGLNSSVTSQMSNGTAVLVQVNGQTNHNNVSDLDLEGENVPELGDLQNLSASEKSNACYNSGSKVSTRLSPSKRDTTWQRGKNDNPVEVVDNISGNSETDKENKKDEVETGVTHSEPTVKNAKPNNTSEAVLSVSTYSLDNLSNVDSYASGGKSSVERTSLRNRSRLKSSAEIIKLRQYPERFLLSSQRLINHSSDKKKKDRSLNDSSVTAKHGSNQSTSSKKQLNVENLSSKSGLKRNRHQYTAAPEEFSEKDSAQKPKSKTSSSYANVSNVDSNMSNSKGKNGDKEFTPTHLHDSHKSSFQSQFEKSINMSNQTTSTKTKTRMAKKTKTVKHLDSKQKTLAQTASKKQDFFSSNDMPQIDATTSSQDVMDPGNQSLHGTLSDTTNVSSHSHSYSSGGRSLRDRSRLATPDSLQEKRQYPVSFYPSKTREDILNASKPTKHKVTPNPKLPTNTELSSMSNSLSNRNAQGQQKLRGASSKPENKSLTKPGKGISTRKKSNDSPSEPNHEDTPVFSPNISKNLVSSHVSEKNASKKSSKTQVLEKTLSKKVLSLPKKPVKKSELSGSIRHEDPPEVSDSACLQPQEFEEPWEIKTASVKSVTKSARFRHRQKPVGSESRKGSAIDETILVRQKVPQKRKLVDQLSQDETVEKARKTSQSGKSQKVILWCEEGQSRLASDVTAYDVIFQAAFDVEKELGDAAEDRITERLVKKVFAGFKRNMKLTIAQELSLKELEKNIKERKKRCKTLASDIAAKRAESVSLQREILSLESETEGNLLRISQWMRSYSRLICAAQNT